jgi:UDPglucose 6-dehydrogenase
MAPRVTVIGTGHLGASHAACLAEFGFEVLGVDSDETLIDGLSRAEPSFHEPGLGPLLRRGLDSGRLSFTTSYQRAADFGDVHFVCVGTPPAAGSARADLSPAAGSGRADLSQVNCCVDSLAPLLTRPCLVVGKSTVPAGTAAGIARTLRRLAPAGEAAELAWNPEFLREGSAIPDTLRPDRIVAGVRSGRAEVIMREIYARPLAAGVPFLVTDLATAELVKMAANAFLATKISFINAMAEVCDAAGADVTLLAAALGHDARIGAAGLRPGLGFGGGCLPKDVRAFMASAGDLGAGQSVELLRVVDEINERCRGAAVSLARELAGGDFAGRRVGVLGAAFKPGSDDIRDSPALDVAMAVHRLGAQVTVYDPAAMERARRQCPELKYADSLLEAARDADVLLLLTEWPELLHADPELLATVVAQRSVVDGRHALDPVRWRAAGWRYRALGRN